MTKLKSSMVTRSITHLATDNLAVLVIQSVFSLLPLGRYLLPLTTLNRYQPTDSSGKSLFTTISMNVFIVRCRISLVTILLLDLVMIHWIHLIQRKSFRDNSNNPHGKFLKIIVRIIVWRPPPPFPHLRDWWLPCLETPRSAAVRGFSQTFKQLKRQIDQFKASLKSQQRRLAYHMCYFLFKHYMHLHHFRWNSKCISVCGFSLNFTFYLGKRK